MHAKCLPILLSLFSVIVFAQYEIPEASVEQLHPKGFSVSIPDEEGISLFAFHGKINEAFDGREAGTFSMDITKPKNGRWTFTDKFTKLKAGDVLYFWTFVQRFDGIRQQGYVKDDQMFTFTGQKPGNNGNKGNKDKNKNNGNGNGNRATTEANEQKPTITTTTTTTTTTSEPTTSSTTTTTQKPEPKEECLPTVTKVNKKRSCAGKLIFQENFGNNFGASDKWMIEVIYSGEPDYEYVVYNDDSRNIYTQKNILYIKPTLIEDRYGPNFVSDPQGLDLGKNCTGIPGTQDCFQKPALYFILPPVLSARINTRDSFSFVYGTVEVRAKLPRGDWIYPELYLNPKNFVYGAGYESGQIRIAFLPGNQILGKTLYGGCILGRTVAARNFAMKSVNSSTNWNDDYHIFSVKWEPESLTLYVDNEQYGRVYPSAGGFASQEHDLELTAANRWRGGTLFAPFDVEMFLTIGVGVGGHTFPDGPNKPWINNDPKGQRSFYRSKDSWFPTWSSDSALQVDYVKVYAL